MKIAFSSKSKWKWEKRTSRPTTKVQDIFNLQDCQCAHLDEITLREERKNATAQNRKKNNKRKPTTRSSKTISTEMPFKNILRQLWKAISLRFTNIYYTQFESSDSFDSVDR